MDAQDVRSVFSPMFRKLKEDLKEEMEMTVRKQLEESFIMNPRTVSLFNKS